MKTLLAFVGSRSNESPKRGEVENPILERRRSRLEEVVCGPKRRGIRPFPSSGNGVDSPRSR